MGRSDVQQMKILAIDTSTATTSVALADCGNILAEYCLHMKENQSNRLVATIEQILAGSRVAWSQVEAVAVAIGPGSFTGLRIGIATAKGMVLGTERKIVGVTTLDALVYNVIPVPGLIACPVVDARKGEIYTSLYRSCNGNWERISPHFSLPVAGLIDLLRERGLLENQILFLGDGLTLYKEELKAALGKLAVFAPCRYWFSSAANVALLGWCYLQDGKEVDVYHLKPLYLRRPEAEIKWKAKKL